MRRLTLFAVLFLLTSCGVPTPTPGPSPTSSASATTTVTVLPSPSPTPDTRCQDMTHVYNPARLKVLSSCVHVNGIVEVVRVEADGDYHILVHVDPGQIDPNGGSWIDSANTTYQHGDLVTEPVCEHAVTQSDAVSACVGYTNPTSIPIVGEHVRVSGPWVEDTAHFSWREVHPATYEHLATLSDPLGGSD